MIITMTKLYCLFAKKISFMQHSMQITDNRFSLYLMLMEVYTCISLHECDFVSKWCCTFLFSEFCHSYQYSVNDNVFA